MKILLTLLALFVISTSTHAANLTIKSSTSQLGLGTIQSVKINDFYLQEQRTTVSKITFEGEKNYSLDSSIYSVSESQQLAKDIKNNMIDQLFCIADDFDKTAKQFFNCKKIEILYKIK